MQNSSPEKLSIRRIVGWASFVVTIVLFAFVSSRAGMRWLGAATLAGAVVQLYRRRIAYGWEGQEPSGYITGIPAILFGLLLGALGLAMLGQPDIVLALFGWDNQ
ncbi:hypothetical protein [Niveibacterium terrae]|uniref:hypothetical protein n=1 Tax=Niveibacterium terrae TaxID=3373598 RepID=UPI003A948602